jgi:DNA-binding transcriptional LysR family regulator
VQLAEAVHDEHLDLAYVINWRLPTGAQYEPLHLADFVLMVAPDHPLAHKEHVSARDVYEAGLITAPLFSQEWPHYDRLLRACGLLDYRVGLEIDGVQARLLATRAGLGVMGVFVPPYAAESLAGQLCPLRMEAPPPKVEFGLVSQPAQRLAPAAQQFVAWLKQVADDA